MSLTLEFADSEVRDVVAEGPCVRIRFAAAAVRDAAGERGWLPSVTLTLTRMEGAPGGDFSHAFGRLAEGRLRQEGRAVPRLSVPATLDGALELVFRFANDTLLSLHGCSLASTVSADARFVPDSSC